MWYRKVYTTFLLIVWLAINSQAQFLPPFKIDRRGDLAYMDSLSRVVKKVYAHLSSEHKTRLNDSLRFETLYYLGRLYGRWAGHKDSIRYFGNELVRQARERQDTEFEIRGILLDEYYYHNILQNYPGALRVNLQALDALRKAKVRPPIAWRVDMNLGEIYGISGDTTNALRFLKKALSGLMKTKNLPGTDFINFQMEIEQKIAFIYFDHNFSESEKHFLAVEALFSNKDHQSNHAYSYDDLSELYLKYQQYNKAIYYGKKAALIWEAMNNPFGMAGTWSTLACAYAELGQNELALAYTNRVFAQQRAISYSRRRAHYARYVVAERQGDWKNGLINYKQFIILRDSAESDLRAKELATIQKRAELDQLTTQNQQEHQLQHQRLLMIQKQAELDRLRANVQNDALREKALLAEQDRQLDNQKAQLLLASQQSRQKQLQNQFQKERFQKEAQLQQNHLIYVGTTSLFLISVLILLLYTQQLRKRRAEAVLQLTKTQAEANAQIMNAQDSERQRIAADLHDDLGGVIATINHLLSQTLQSHSIREFQQRILQIKQVSAQAGDKVRQIAHNLMPPDFERLGLVESVQQFIRSLNDPRFQFVVFGHPRRLTPEIELNAYRIISELIHNIQKHAQAQHVSVQLLFHSDSLSLVIEDDGIGNQSTKNTAKLLGIGLKNISSRVNFLNARWQTDATEQGTSTLVEIPYGFVPQLHSHRRRPQTI
ncbi:hypothetical protein GCM10028805_17360 [Spirosoma harenae]